MATESMSHPTWTDPDAHDAAWAEVCVDAAVRRWKQGLPPDAQAVLDRQPALADHPEAVVRLIYEAWCLERAADPRRDINDLLARFPRWRPQLEVLLQLDVLLDLDPLADVPAWPGAGEEFAGFRLVADLGRGAQGRVFLATESGLADRPVVLKLTPRTGQEHLSLARLQHTHIVPLYTLAEDDRHRLRALCMPYFGGAALHELLRALEPVPLSARTGQHLLEALDRLQAGRPLPGTITGSARQLLGQLSYVQAVCWMGACLADALHYAHERGLVHCDVKPSNVLLAGDGQPMLLDFHIAHEPLRPGQMPPERLGGTPVYASPEQRAALEALGAGRPVPLEVDGRSDIYSLGLLLAEALGTPVGLWAPVVVHPHSRLVSRGLTDILNRCLCPEAGQRYGSAAALAEDLRRHLNDLPLRGVPNRSLLERWRKWRRRRPSSLAFALAAIAVVSAILAVGTLTLSRFHRQQQEAETALAEGRQYLRSGAYGEAAERLSHGLTVAQRLPWGDRLAGELDHELHRARRAQAARQLHALADRFRFLCGSLTPEGNLATLRPLWQAVWDKRGTLLDRQVAELPADVEGQLRTDLLDLGLVWADLSMRLAEPDGRAKACQEALAVLDEIERLFGTSGAVYRQRAACLAALGRPEAAAAAEARAAALPPRTAWEHYLLGRTRLQLGDLDAALPALRRAVKLQPQGFWQQFHRGVCAHRLGNHQEAARAFEVCIALAPDKAECYCIRALALAALGEHDAALGDYQRALQLNPQLAAATLPPRTHRRVR
jgi:serine/threonine protein kinase